MINLSIYEQLCFSTARIETEDENGGTEDEFEKMWTFHPQDDVDIYVLPIAHLLTIANKNEKNLFYRCY